MAFSLVKVIQDPALTLDGVVVHGPLNFEMKLETPKHMYNSEDPLSK